MGVRAMRNVFSTPSSTTSTRARFTPDCRRGSSRPGAVLPCARTGGIESRRKNLWVHFLADHLFEGLRFVGPLLPMALDTMAEDLVEEHAAGAPRKNGRAGVGIGHRSRAQALQDH